MPPPRWAANVVCAGHVPTRGYTDDEDGQKAAAANKRGPYEFRPDLVCHDDDLRNLVCVRDYDSTLDGMTSFDIMFSDMYVSPLLLLSRPGWFFYPFQQVLPMAGGD